MTQLNKEVWIEWRERDVKVDFSLILGRAAHIGACVLPEDSYPEDPPEIEIETIWLDGDIDVTDDVYKDGMMDEIEELVWENDHTWEPYWEES